MDVSVTEASLNNASLSSIATLQPTVFVQLCLEKTHLVSGVEGHIQSKTVTKAKGEGLGADPLRRPTTLNCRHMLVKQ